MLAKQPRTEKIAQKLLSWLEHLVSTPLLELLGFGAGAWIYLYLPVHLSYPMGYGGFYALMAENVAANPFHPALHLPFYGGGNAIFAYPPLGIYLMGLWLRLSGYNPELPLAPDSPLLLYFRFAPAIYCIIGLVAVYFFVRTLFDSRLKAVIAVVLVSTVGTIYAFQATAAGVVRALAFALCMAGLAFFVQAVKRIDGISPRKFKIFLILAGMCFGGTILTHLNYVVFFALSIVILPFYLGLRKSILPVFWTVVIGLALATPWIIWSGLTFGWQVFANAFHTHNSTGYLPQLLANPVGTLKEILVYLLQLRGDWSPSPLFGAGLIGLGYSLVRRKWLIPVWFGVVLISLGGSERYLTMFLCFAIADLLGDLPNLFFRLPPEQSQLSRLFNNFSFAVAVLLVVCYFWALGRENVKYSYPILNSDFLQATEWIEENTLSGDAYLFLSTSYDTPEWIPYLTRRNSLFAPWGGEWNGTYNTEHAGLGEIRECIQDGSFPCISDFLNSNNLSPDLLIVPTELEDMLMQIETQSNWRPIFENDVMVVFIKP